MRGIARKSAPITVVVYHPKTEAGQRELAQRVAGVHADVVSEYIMRMSCPTEQKVRLLDAVIKDKSNRDSG